MLANSSVLRTPTGSGVVPTQLIGGIEYEGYVPAQVSGHLLGTESLYFGQVRANVALDQLMTLFNVAGSGKVVRVKAIVIKKEFGTVTGAAMQLDLRQVISPANDGSLVGVTKLDSNTDTKPAEIQLVGGDTPSLTTFGSTLYSRFYHTEETNEAAAIQEAFPFWPPAAIHPHIFQTFQDITLREDEGIAVHCRTSVTAVGYSWNFFYTQSDV